MAVVRHIGVVGGLLNGAIWWLIRNGGGDGDDDETFESELRACVEWVVS